MSKLTVTLYYCLALLLFACAGPKKEHSSDSDAAKGVAEVNRVMQKMLQAQSDLLALDEYSDGVKALNKAEKGLNEGSNTEAILNNAAIAKDYFNKANILSTKRKVDFPRILRARQSALDSGSRNSQLLLEVLWDIDDDLRDETDDFSQVLNLQGFSEFHKKYLSLEVKAVQFTQLDAVRSSIQKAASSNADNLAPSTLAMAMLDLTGAENLIAMSPRNPRVHLESVLNAEVSADLLSDVMDVILNAEGTPEKTALTIVAQNRRLGILEKNLKSTEAELGLKNAELKTTKSDLMGIEGTLESQNQALAKSSTQVKFQIAMDEARRRFSRNEASVYQQGNNLIFRLKKVNFATGSAVISAASKPLLEKINDIINNMDADMVVVQGHTDAIGSEDVNKQLSTKRAISVSLYLTSFGGSYKIASVGFGESRPIASNETFAGRAINRRVDLVVTVKQ
jgi:OOP family OmpA-OmpF porin